MYKYRFPEEFFLPFCFSSVCITKLLGIMPVFEEKSESGPTNKCVPD